MTGRRPLYHCRTAWRLFGIGLLALAGCQRTSGSPVPPFAASGPGAVMVIDTERDSAAGVRFVIPGTGMDVWNLVNGAVQDTIFRLVTANPSEGWMRNRSVARGLSLNVRLVPHGTDSTEVLLSGSRYTGKSDRPGYTLVAREYWPAILTGEPDVARLVAEANRIRAGIDRERRGEEERMSAAIAAGRDPQVVPMLAAPVSDDSIVRVLSDGKLGYCRANSVRRDRHLDSLLIVDVENRPEWCPLPSYYSGLAGNTWILADPRSVAIGDTVSVCWVSYALREYRFVAEAWYSDPERCRYDRNQRQRSEPNMLLLRRMN